MINNTCIAFMARRFFPLPAFLFLLLTGCGQSSDNSQTAEQETDTTGINVPGIIPDGQFIVKGIIVTASKKLIEIKTADSTMTIRVIQPLHLYSREPGSIANVKNTSFIGVTTNKQPDGTELAAEIHIFPEELRGLNEGSNIMHKNGAAAGRMTNGNVSSSNDAPESRMSNGSVKLNNATSLEVQFQGHTKKVMVPPGITVTEFMPSPVTLAPGIRVDLLVKKADDGSYVTGKGILQKISTCGNA